MFFLDGPKKICLEKFTGRLETDWTDDLFPDCVREVYKSTSENPTEMHSAVVSIAYKHAKSLGSKESFLKLIAEGGEFVVDCFACLTTKREHPNEWF